MPKRAWAKRTEWKEEQNENESFQQKCEMLQLKLLYICKSRGELYEAEFEIWASSGPERSTEISFNFAKVL